ncbi:MAG TPA: hypothetical protein VHI93_01425 [Candidatus Thermoplasmatota archaeon]|nr:hypothetical protein [Candidatus Thermoplasmatota archaeon]
METRTRTLFDSASNPTFTAAGTSIIKVPLDQYVRQADLRVTVTYNTTAGATVAQDGVLNTIARIDLVRNGKIIRSWAPSRYWYKQPLDLGTKPSMVDVTTAVANGKTAEFVLPIFWRLDARRVDQMAYLLPAKYLDTCEIRITWAATTGVLGTNQTITAATVEPTLHEVNLTAQEEVQLYGVSGDDVVKSNKSRLLQIVEQEQTKVVDAAYSNFQLGLDLPSGSFLTRSFLFATLNGARDDTLVTQYRVRQDSPTRIDYVEESWAISQCRDLQEYGFPAPISGNRYLVGFTVLDYVDFKTPSTPGGGLNLVGRRSGDVKLYVNTIAPVGTTNLVLLTESVQPISV